MLQFEIVCNFQGGRKETVGFYIGLPEPGHHPIHFQAKWLNGEKGGSVPEDVMKSLQELYNTAKSNNLDFTELCSFALNSATKNQKTVNKGGNGFTSARIGQQIDQYAKEFLEKNGINDQPAEEEKENNHENQKIEINPSSDSQNPVNENQSEKSAQFQKPQIIPKQDSPNNNSDKNLSEVQQKPITDKNSEPERPLETSKNDDLKNNNFSSVSNVYGDDTDLI